MPIHLKAKKGRDLPLRVIWKRDEQIQSELISAIAGAASRSKTKPTMVRPMVRHKRTLRAHQRRALSPGLPITL